MNSVSFTGHRNIKCSITQLKTTLYAELEKAINQGTSDFYAGGALGFDTIAAKVVLQLRKNYRHIRLHLVLPCLPQEQCSLWSQEDRDLFDSIMTAADTVEYISEHMTKDCMKGRNKKLIEYADKCYCYYNPKRSRSGTGQTVRMAQRKGIAIINLYSEFVDCTRNN